MGTTPSGVDLSAIQAEVQKELAGLSTDQLQADLLKFKVRQKKQQKKQSGKGSQKAYQMKQREKMKLMKAKAIELGIWEKINDEADKQAEEELATETVESEEEAA